MLKIISGSRLKIPSNTPRSWGGEGCCLSCKLRNASAFAARRSGAYTRDSTYEAARHTGGQHNETNETLPDSCFIKFVILFVCFCFNCFMLLLFYLYITALFYYCLTIVVLLLCCCFCSLFNDFVAGRVSTYFFVFLLFCTLHF